MTSSGKLLRPIGFKPEEISALVNRDVVEQHAEEAAFLWLLRDGAAQAPNYNLQDLADLDERVEANIEGLRVAGDVGWEFCDASLDWQEPGEVFTAGVLAFGSSKLDRIQKVLKIGFLEPELGRALGSALGWLPFGITKRLAEWLMKSGNTKAMRIGLAGFAVHRQDPGSFLVDAISSTDPHLRARALKASGDLGRKDTIRLLVNALTDADEACRFYAAWSAVRIGQRNDSVFKVLHEIALHGKIYCELAADMLMRVLDVDLAKKWCRSLLKNPATARCALVGTGALGDPELIDDLLMLMEKDEFSRVAGEAFSMITGVDIEYEDLDGEPPEGFSSGPSEDFDDEDIAMDPDEDLPWPNPALIRDWWQAHFKDYRYGTRYLRGKKKDFPSLINAVVHGNQRQRKAAALELALREPEKPLFETRAPGKRQLMLLKQWIS